MIVVNFVIFYLFFIPSLLFIRGKRSMLIMMRWWQAVNNYGFKSQWLIIDTSTYYLRRDNGIIVGFTSNSNCEFIFRSIKKQTQLTFLPKENHNNFIFIIFIKYFCLNFCKLISGQYEINKGNYFGKIFNGFIKIISIFRCFFVAIFSLLSISIHN